METVSVYMKTTVTSSVLWNHRVARNVFHQIYLIQPARVIFQAPYWLCTTHLTVTIFQLWLGFHFTFTQKKCKSCYKQHLVAGKKEYHILSIDCSILLLYVTTISNQFYLFGIFLVQCGYMISDRESIANTERFEKARFTCCSNYQHVLTLQKNIVHYHKPFSKCMLFLLRQELLRTFRIFLNIICGDAPRQLAQFVESKHGKEMADIAWNAKTRKTNKGKWEYRI